MNRYRTALTPFYIDVFNHDPQLAEERANDCKDSFSMALRVDGRTIYDGCRIYMLVHLCWRMTKLLAHDRFGQCIHHNF